MTTRTITKLYDGYDDATDTCGTSNRPASP